MTFGEKLSTLRKTNNYTQEQLAELLGVSRQSISKWESNIAYPETDKLIKIGKLFNCSTDYLLNDDIAEKWEMNVHKESPLQKLANLLPERRSKKTVLGMPLYHIGQTAHGFFAIGLKSQGVFSIGLISKGIVSLGILSLGIMSFGLFSLGVFSFGIVSLGLISAGAFSLGLLAVGAIALGLFAAGAISLGVLSCGALSVGYFSLGALAVGKYAAIGDHAYGMIAIGETVAEGNVYSHAGNLATADMPTIMKLLNTNVPSWLGWAKDIFVFFMPQP